ncbi:MAG: hypothetical protein NVS3B1_20110 [Marmoricola sp.]
MNRTTRRGLRATAAVVAVGLIGLQSIVSSALASTTTTTTWMPSSGPTLWSDTNCATDNSAPTSTPTTPPSDALSLTGTQTYLPDAGSHATGPGDVAWAYAPASGHQGGPVVTIPTSTTDLSLDVSGATSGRLLVVYNTTSNNQPVNYIGVRDFATTAGWQTVAAGSLTWYQWQAGTVFSAAHWAPANVPFLQSQNVPETLSAFFQGKTGTAQAAFELGCTGGFALDHLRVTDANTNIADYDAQTPTSTTTATAGASTVGYGATTTITPSTSTTDAGVTTANPAGLETLMGSTDGGATWSTVQTAPTGHTFTVQPTRTTSYLVRYDSATPLDPQPSSSAPVTVAVIPKAALAASAARVDVGRADTFTLRLTPALAAATVTFQQLSGTSWVSIGTASTNASGVATLVKARAIAGAWRVRATVPAQPGYLPITSNAVTVGVYQPVAISIARSASSVRVGYSFRIYGLVTPHVYGMPLQLQQYLGGRWQIVATGHSGTRGVYSFTKVARYVGTAAFRVIAPASGYRLRGGSPTARVTIYIPYSPPPPPPTGGGGTGGGGGGSGIG